MTLSERIEAAEGPSRELDVGLSDREMSMLLGMADNHCGEYDDFAGDGASWFWTFKGIAGLCDVPPTAIRRTVRALKRKGLADFSKGLMSEDGDLLGAGYGLNRKGRALAAAIRAREGGE